MVESRYNNVDPKKKMTECVCPKCGKTHELMIYWTGRGIPRIFCSKCYLASFAVDHTASSRDYTPRRKGGRK